MQNRLENLSISYQPVFEKELIQLVKSDRELLTQILTDYSLMRGEQVIREWRELGEFLIRKYNDGYIQGENFRPHEKGYPEEWLKHVIKERPEQFKLPKKDEAVPESQLVD